MAHNSDDTVNTEVEDRLQTLFFGGAGESPDTVKDSVESAPNSHIEEVKGHPKDQKDHGPVENSLLKELGAVVLSVDWEISDEIMNHLLEKVAGLKSIYKDDRNNLLLLQLLDSVGKYIKINKVDAHPDSINVLNSVYSGLAKTVLSEGMTAPEKKKILLTQVTEFKRLKEQVALTKGGSAKKRDGHDPIPGSDKPLTGERKSATEPQKKIASERGEDMSSMLPHEAFAFALEEIREVIKSEFRALRAELKLWREDSSSQ